jgi:hypothetical protein
MGELGDARRLTFPRIPSTRDVNARRGPARLRFDAEDAEDADDPAIGIHRGRSLTLRQTGHTAVTCPMTVAASAERATIAAASTRVRVACDMDPETTGRVKYRGDRGLEFERFYPVSRR